MFMHSKKTIGQDIPLLTRCTVTKLISSASGFLEIADGCVYLFMSATAGYTEKFMFTD